MPLIPVCANLLRKLALIGVSLSIALAFLAPARAQYRDIPMIHDITDPREQPKWHAYLKKLRGTGHQHEEISEGIHWLIVYSRRADKPEAAKYIAELRKLRAELPLEFRWFLSALEIKHGMIDADTLKDAESALRSTTIVDSGLIWRNVADKLYYHLPGDKKDVERMIHFRSLENLVFLQRYWQQLPLHVDIKGDQELEAKRVRWMRAIRTLVGSDIRLYELTELLKDLDPPAMRKFASRAKASEFLTLAVETLEAVTNSVGNFSQEGPTQFRFGIFSIHRDSYDAIRGFVEAWIHKDVGYLVEQYNYLRRRGLVQLDQLLARPALEEDRIALERALDAKGGALDSYLVAALLYGNRYSSAPHADYAAKASLAAVQILLGAAIERRDVRFELKGFDNLYFTQKEFGSFVRSFLDIYRKTGVLAPEAVAWLAKRNVLRTEAMSEHEWLELEWMRVECLERAMPADAFKAMLVKTAVGEKGISLHEQILAAKYLRAKLQAPDLERISTLVKSRAQGVAPESYAGAQAGTWSRDNAALVYVIRALHPEDRELVKHLSTVYSERFVDGPISAEAALYVLRESGTATEDVKASLLHRLRFVSAGDSAGSFTSLIKMFPEEGVEIVQILYRHRSAPEKLAPMLVSLVTQIESNYQLFLSVRSGLRSQKDASITNALYQGQPLDAWLESKLKSRGSWERLCKAGLSVEGKK